MSTSVYRMLAEAEKYKAEDERQREKVAARNQLECYVFQVKQAVEDAAGDKLSEDDKAKVKSECDACLQWLDSNALAEKEEYEDRQKQLTQVCSPIMAKLYQQAGSQQQHSGASNCGQQSGSGFGNYRGPTVEEVD